MIFDLQTMVSDRQAITAPVRSTNTIDLGPYGTPHHAAAQFAYDAGRGVAIPFRIQIVETFAGAFTNLVMSWRTDANTAFSSSTTVQSVSLPLAQCLVGLVLPPFYVPRGTNERYLELFYDLTGTATATAGRVTAGVICGPDAWFR